MAFRARKVFGALEKRAPGMKVKRKGVRYNYTKGTRLPTPALLAARGILARTSRSQSR